MSDLIENPSCWFSHAMAQFINIDEQNRLETDLLLAKLYAVFPQCSTAKSGVAGWKCGH